MLIRGGHVLPSHAATRSDGAPALRPLSYVLGAGQEEVAAENDEEHDEEEPDHHQEDGPPHVPDPVERRGDDGVEEKVGQPREGPFAVDGLAVVQQVAETGEVAARETDRDVLTLVVGQRTRFGRHGELKGRSTDTIL